KGGVMSALRPLPPRPSLEFERKEAKGLLRRLRAGDPEAVARVRQWHPAFSPSQLGDAKLADAQLVIAREYGFASWPRLVRWFGDVERLRPGNRAVNSREDYEGSVRWLMAEHRAQRTGAGRTVAAYLPRLQGLRVEDVFVETLSDDEARLAVARSNGFPSWEVLLEFAAKEELRRNHDAWHPGPLPRVFEAMKAADVEALKRVVEAHPELLETIDDDVRRGSHLMMMALQLERKDGRDRIRPIIEWLESKGLDVQLVLNLRLCGHARIRPDTVRWLIDRGADPNWIAPSGIPVLEHALLRYESGVAVDALAEHATPRDALWVAAGLGDIDGVRRFLDQNGRPTPAARRLRPDFSAVGFIASLPSLPDADDEELFMEALFVAVLNGRVGVIEYMATRGAPLNSVVYGMPLIVMAVAQRLTAVVETLVRCGADPGLRGWNQNTSAREMARQIIEHLPEDPDCRRIAVLCGLDPDAVLAERNARAVSAPEIHSSLSRALELAADDAARLDKTDVGIENLLFGLLRAGGPPLYYITEASRMDVVRFHADLADRLRPSDDRISRRELALNAEAQSVVDEAFVLASERKREIVDGVALAAALITRRSAPVVELLTRYGANESLLNAGLERWM
ncbi:MAG: hypothetical protein ABI601_20695, partial [bacterium]